MQLATRAFTPSPAFIPDTVGWKWSKAGFKLERLTGLTINVLDDIEQNFRLEVGSVSESVTVEADAVNVNTTDGTVSTVVDRQFVEDLPLNGRNSRH